MKELLLGNAAIARGLYEAGCSVVSSYPGTPSTEITETASEYDEIYSEWAPNEKVAMEVAFGASLAGVRSFTAMKHVGLNVAADPLFTIAYTGVNAGMVIVVADDPGLHSSQNEQDSRNYAIAAKLPMLEPADSEECLSYTKYAYELSELFDVPVMIRTSTRIAHSQSIVETSDRVVPDTKEYKKDVAKYVMMPAAAKARHRIVEERLEKLRQLAEDSFLNRIEMGDTKMGIITSGASYQYVKDIFGESVSVLKLGMVNPLPIKLIQDFASRVDKLIVVEELDSIIENHCRKLYLEVTGKDVFPLVDEFSPNLIANLLGLEVNEGISMEEPLPQRPPVMCAGCPHRGMFYTLNKKGVTVLGDIGCYTLGSMAPLSAMDMTICMGASVSSLHGFNRAGGKNSVAVIGDSTFVHTGINGLIDIAYNGSDSTVIIVDNSTTGMTGHQDNPTTGYDIKGEPAGKIDLEALCKALGIQRVRVVDPYDLDQCSRVLDEEMDALEPSVIISRRPCVLLRSVSAKPPISADEDKCSGCQLCMDIGCPAISMKDNKTRIDATLCTGCKVCIQLCNFDALVSNEV
ncbi:MAG: indolepyruvate ferredoxin oxidoreductase subunit alpha [Oscillospiraceae bacterium]|nr:indolepyruvate ferredoxin oxidoreductase subunit alpha [Oscillospiraceae bacterium]